MLNKKAVSVVVGYVLLVVIAIGLAGLVYGFLVGFVPKDTETCPEDISLVILEETCEVDGTLTIKVENKGLFSLDGFYIRASKDVDKLATYNNIKKTNTNTQEGQIYFTGSSGSLIELAPGDNVEINLEAVVKTQEDPDFSELKKIEIQPFIKKDKGVSLCAYITYKEINC